jgi:hypothetical protein
LLEFWHNLQFSSPGQVWRDFPPLQRALTIFVIALLFAHFFIRDYNRGGRRYVVYGPVALLLFIYAASLSGFF